MEFKSFDPNAMVRGANIRATLAALHAVSEFGEDLVRPHAIDPASLTPDNLVPVQRWLDALRDIQAKVGDTALRESGARIVENAEFPPQYPTVEAILLALDDIYHVNHTGNVGRYRSEQRPDGAVVIHCETPYPRNFERGLVEGICRNRRAGDALYCVEYRDGPIYTDLTCTLTVWRA